MERKLLPGDFGLTKIKGWTGIWVSLGQWLNGDASRYTHAFIVVDDNYVIEAQPGGAVLTPLADYLARTDVVYSNLPLTDQQREIIVAMARQYKGTPYSFLDYLAIALLRFGIKPKRLISRVVDSDHLICSQLVTSVYAHAGVDLFNDGTLPWMVTPGDLANRLLELNSAGASISNSSG